MMRTLAQTGNGWMTFKDKCNRASNQTANAKNVIHLSNLCTEILEVTTYDETAVCNLGSINLGQHLNEFNELISTNWRNRATGSAATGSRDRPEFLPDRVGASRQLRWRPVGLGMMGLQDVFFRMRLAFDSEAARACRKIAEEIYYQALWTSTKALERASISICRNACSAGRVAIRCWISRRKHGALGCPA